MFALKSVYNPGQVSETPFENYVLNRNGQESPTTLTRQHCLLTIQNTLNIQMLNYISMGKNHGKYYYTLKRFVTSHHTNPLLDETTKQLLIKYDNCQTCTLT